MNVYLTKRFYVFAGLGLVVILFLVWLTVYLSSGKIVITSNKSNTIVLQKTGGGGVAFTKTGMGSLSANVKHGQYTVTIKNASQTSAKVIDFYGGHKTFRYSIYLSKLLDVEPVADQDAADMVVNNDELVYLNADDNNIYKIDSSNNLDVINASQNFQVIKWADTSFGIGQTNNERLYAINNGSVSLLDVPFNYGGKSVSFAISPTQQIYVSYGPSVYIGSQNGNFKKIYTATTSSPALSAGSSLVDVADGTLDQGTAQKPEIALVNTSGKYIRKVIDSQSSILSPNGKYLAVEDESGIAEIYNSDLENPVTLPTPLNNSIISHVTWLNDDTLLYSCGDQLWEYSLAQHKGELLANMPLNWQITGLAINQDGTYVYLTTSDSNGNNQVIWRIGFNGQKVSALANQLQDILPIYDQQFQLSYINFSGTPVVDIGEIYGVTQNAQQLATQVLQNLGVDTSQVSFSIVAQ